MDLHVYGSVQGALVRKMEAWKHQKKKETKVACQNKFGSVLNNVYKYSLSQDSLEPLTCYQVL